jgi:hypothetical protein
MSAKQHLATATNAYAILKTGTLIKDGPIPTIQGRPLTDLVSAIRDNMRLAGREITPAVAAALEQAERGQVGAIRKLPSKMTLAMRERGRTRARPRSP